MSIPQHRKPGSATKARTMAIRAAAIGAVAVPGAALTAHELAGQQQPETAPLRPLDGSELLGQAANDHASDQDLYSPSEVESTMLRAREQRTIAAEQAEDAASRKAAVPAKQPAIPQQKTNTVSYTVQEGDTLSGIAERTLGSASSYTDVFALNKDRAEPGGARFTDPSLIQPGWTIALPSGAKTHSTASPARRTSTSSSNTASAKSGSHGTTVDASDTVTSSSTSSSSSSKSGESATGDLNGWINDAIGILADHGIHVSYEAVYETVMHESGGNPDAVNGEDSNAAEGHPSIGLMQTIQSTFDAYALPGYDDIYNPVDNIIAGARYAAAVYGSLDEMVEARCDGSCWRGY